MRERFPCHHDDVGVGTASLHKERSAIGACVDLQAAMPTPSLLMVDRETIALWFPGKS
jgi:hypothetical protein